MSKTKTKPLSYSDAPIPEAVREIIKDQAHKIAQALAGTVPPPEWQPKEVIAHFVPAKHIDALRNSAKMRPSVVPSAMPVHGFFKSSLTSDYSKQVTFNWRKDEHGLMLFPDKVKLQKDHEGSPKVLEMEAWVDHHYQQAKAAGEVTVLIECMNAACKNLGELKYVWPSLPLLVNMKRGAPDNKLQAWLNRFDKAGDPKDAPTMWPGFHDDVQAVDTLVAQYGIAAEPPEPSPGSVLYAQFSDGALTSDVYRRFRELRQPLGEKFIPLYC